MGVKKKMTLEELRRLRRRLETQLDEDTVAAAAADEALREARRASIDARLQVMETTRILEETKAKFMEIVNRE